MMTTAQKPELADLEPVGGVYSYGDLVIQTNRSDSGLWDARVLRHNGMVATVEVDTADSEAQALKWLLSALIGLYRGMPALGEGGPEAS